MASKQYHQARAILLIAFALIIAACAAYLVYHNLHKNVLAPTTTDEKFSEQYGTWEPKTTTEDEKKKK